MFVINLLNLCKHSKLANQLFLTLIHSPHLIPFHFQFSISFYFTCRCVLESHI